MSLMIKKLSIYSLYFALWQGIAMVVNRPVILPSFVDVFLRIFNLLLTSDLYLHVSMTLIRVIQGTALAFVLALIVALMTHESKLLKDLLSPLILITKTIPNITYILLVLIWFARELSVIAVSFLILFPVLYSQFKTGLDQINPELIELFKLYPEGLVHKVSKVLVPLIKPYLFAGLKNGLSLGFKVGVMAEILGQVQPGLGYLMHIARMNFETTDLFAYTAIMILVVVIIEKGIDLFLTKK